MKTAVETWSMNDNENLTVFEKGREKVFFAEILSKHTENLEGKRSFVDFLNRMETIFVGNMEVSILCR